MLEAALLVSILAISIAWILWVHFGNHDARRNIDDLQVEKESSDIGSNFPIAAPTSVHAGSLRIRLCYRNRIGELSKRVVRPNGRFNSKGFDAWCEMRNENRTFLYEGIESAEDAVSDLPISILDIYLKINPRSLPPLLIRAWKPWRVMQPLMMLVRDCSGSGIRDAERVLIKAAGQAALGVDVVEDEDLDALLRCPTANINPGFFLPRLSEDEREICRKAASLLASVVPKKYSDQIRVTSSDWF